MKILGLFVLILVSLSYIYSSEVEIQALKSQKQNDNQAMRSLNAFLSPKPTHVKKKIKIKGGKIFWEGWIKFFKYSGSRITRHPIFLKILNFSHKQ